MQSCTHIHSSICVWYLQKRREKQDHIRKTQRDKLIQAKRRKLFSSSSNETNGLTEANSIDFTGLKQSLDALQNANSLKYSDAVAHLKVVRHALSHEGENVPIDFCLQHGVIKALEWASQPAVSGGIASAPAGAGELRYEASWIVANLAAGTPEQTKQLNTVIPLQLHLLDTDDILLVEQITWTIGNISGDVQEWRDWLINNGCLPALQRQLRNKKHKELIRVTCWTLSNLLRGQTPAKPFVDVQIPHMVIEIMSDCLNQTSDSSQLSADERHKYMEILTECSWVVAYLAAREEEVVEELVNLGVVPLLVRCLSKGHPPVILPALRSLGNISGCGNHALTSTILEQNAFLSVLHTIVSSPFVSSADNDTANLPAAVAAQTPNKQVRVKEALWVCANIAAGTFEQLRTLISASFIPTIVQHLESGWRIKTNAALVLYNIALGMLVYSENGGDASFVKNTVDELLRYESVLPTFIEFLTAPDIELVKVSLVFCELVLKFSSRGQTIFEEQDGITALEHLVHQGPGDQDSQEVFDESLTNAVRNKASALLDEYFGEEPEGDEPAMEGSFADAFQAGAAQNRPARGVNLLPAWMQNNS